VTDDEELTVREGSSGTVIDSVVTEEWAWLREGSDQDARTCDLPEFSQRQSSSV
jgi:hypothetical protein